MRLTLTLTVAAIALGMFGSSSCAVFGATLPPGAAGGSFLDQPSGALPFNPANAAHKQALDASARAHVDANIDVLMALADASRELRADLVSTERALVAHVEKTGSVDAEGLRRIRDLAQRYLELDALLYSVWTTYRDHLPYRSEPDPYAPMRASTMFSSATREAGGLTALTAELIRLDNAAAVIATLEQHHAITRFLNRGDDVLELPAEGFDRCVGALYDPDHRALVERQLDAFLGERERLTTSTDARIGWLVTTIQASTTGTAIVDEGDAGRRFAFLWKIVERSALDATGIFLDAYIETGYVEEATSDSAEPSE